MNYIDQKEFQNDSGKKIVQNIKLTKNNPRTFNNSFSINYTMKNFPALNIIEEIKNDNNKNHLKKILKDYYQLNLDNDDNNFNIDFSRNTVINFPKKDETKKHHVKNSTSLFQFNNTNETFFTNQETPLLFYKKDGFLFFLNEISEIIQKDKKDFNTSLYIKDLNQEIKDLLKFNKLIEEENIFGMNENGKNIIIEDFGDEIEYDKEDNKINNEMKEKEKNNIENNEGIIPPNDNISIISFNLYNKEKENFIKKKEKGLKMNHELQYYLFLAFNLEEIKRVNDFKQTFIKGLSIPNDEDINDYINEIIIKLYKLSYKCEDKKEFPFLRFYLFLKNLDIKELESLKIEKEYTELYKIFTIVLNIKIKARQSSNLTESKKNDNLLMDEMNENYFISRSLTKTLTISSELHNINPFKEKNKFENEIIIINNNESEFQSNGTPDLTSFTQILPIIIKSSLPTQNDLENKTLNEIMDETNIKMKNQALIELIARLRDFNPKTIDSINDTIVFWINLFNSLLLFTIFYKKYTSLNTEKDWKLFLKNIYFNIGQKNYSFNDIQIIIFGKTIFPADKYKAEKYVINSSIENLIKKERKSKNENEKNEYYISYFCLYLPTQQFLPFTIFNSDTLKADMEKKDRMYFSEFINLSDNILTISKFILYVEPSFTSENIIKKYELTIDGDIYESIIDKSFSKIVKKGNENDWKLNFSNINEEIFVIKNINTNNLK